MGGLEIVLTAIGGVVVCGVLTAMASAARWARQGRTTGGIPLVAPERSEFGDARAIVAANGGADVIDLQERRRNADAVVQAAGSNVSRTARSAVAMAAGPENWKPNCVA